jgi:hypothetical protein
MVEETAHLGGVSGVSRLIKVAMDLTDATNQDGSDNPRQSVASVKSVVYSCFVIY